MDLALQRAIDYGAQLFLVEVQQPSCEVVCHTPRHIGLCTMTRGVCSKEHPLCRCCVVLSNVWMQVHAQQAEL